jgi:hypothetical protein
VTGAKPLQVLSSAGSERGANDDAAALRISSVPLPLAGTEVTLGTDNRYLRCEGQRTLRSEYLTAAELVGGLARWEVPQIVKAGFKHAFLDKVELHTLFKSAEE